MLPCGHASKQICTTLLNRRVCEQNPADPSFRRGSADPDVADAVQATACLAEVRSRRVLLHVPKVLHCRSGVRVAVHAQPLHQHCGTRETMCPSAACQ